MFIINMSNIATVLSVTNVMAVAVVAMASCGGPRGGLGLGWPRRNLLVVVGPRLTVQAQSVRPHVDRAHRVGYQRPRGGSRDLPVAPAGRDADLPLRPDPAQLRLRPGVPLPAGEPVAPDPGAQGGRRPAHAPRESLPLDRRDVVTPAHHELLDLAPVVRRRQAVRCRWPPRDCARGRGRGVCLILHFRGAEKVQPERPRGADPEVTPWFHDLDQKRVVRSGVAQALFTIRVATQSVLWAWLKCLFFSNLTFRGRDIRVALDVVFGSSRWLPRIGSASRRLAP